MFRKKMQSVGHLDLIFGPMFSGKTTELVRRLGTWVDIGYPVLYINHSLDTRGESGMSTHSSTFTTLSPQVENIQTDLLEKLDVTSYQVIGIDEAQFFPDLVPMVKQWVNEKCKTVYVSGLDGDAQQQRFGTLLDLIPYADSAYKLQALCYYCLQTRTNMTPSTLPRAPFTLRTAGNEEQVLIGAEESYRPVCRYHLHTIKQAPHK